MLMKKSTKYHKDKKVGMVSALSCLEADNKKSLLDKVSVFAADYFGNKKFLNLIKRKE